MNNNVNNVRNNLLNIATRVETNAKKELLRYGYRIEKDAKRNVPVHQGILRNSINTTPSEKNGEYIVKVGTNLAYAAVIEFGRAPGSKMPIDTDGRPFQSLIDWCKKKVLGGIEVYEGEAEDVAWAIAFAIKRNGTQPQPYLIPAYIRYRKNVKEIVKQAVQKALKSK